ncbi:MAG: hypothetical protein KJO04_00805 [Bacteroidia bacterium]|nr:hypothetical protein [Bacteroidia bacterium]
MASIRDLKKEINSVLGGIIEAVYIVEATQDKKDSKAGTEIIDGAINTFDELMTKVGAKDVSDKKKHFNDIRAEFEKKAKGLADKVNKMAD